MFVAHMPLNITLAIPQFDLSYFTAVEALMLFIEVDSIGEPLYKQKALKY